MDKTRFYSEKTVSRTEWWLDECAFPDAVWARLRIFSDGSADACWVQGEKLYGFDSAEYAGYFLSEDEYVRLEGLDAGMSANTKWRISELCPPDWQDSPDQPFEYRAPINNCQRSRDRRVVHSQALTIFEPKSVSVQVAPQLDRAAERATTVFAVIPMSRRAPADAWR